MRSLALLATAVFAFAEVRPAPDASHQEQTISSIRKYAVEQLAEVGCVQAAVPNSKTLTVDFEGGHRGPAVEASSLLKEVFAPSSNAQFRFDHFAEIGGKKLAAYAYSYSVAGKNHSGVVYADQETGAIARITFRGESPAHLFCDAAAR